MATRVRYEISAVDKTKRALNQIKGNVNGVKAAFAGLAGALSVGAFTALVKNTTAAADQINKLSTQLGVSTEALSQYQFVAQQTGVTFQTLTTAFQRQARRVAEAAQGTGEASKALKELGINAEALNQLAPDKQFEVLADAIGGVSNSSDRVRLAFKLWDSEGVRLLRTIEGGSAAIREQREEADKIGLTIDQKTADSLSNLQNAFGTLSAQVQATALNFVGQLEPALTGAIKFLSELMPKALRATANWFNEARATVLDATAALFDFFKQADKADTARQAAAGFRAEIKGLGDEAKNAATKLGEAAQAGDLFDESLKKTANTTRTAKQELEAVNPLLARAKSIIADTRTPMEEFAAGFGELRQLFAAGLIDLETYTRAFTKLQGTFIEATTGTDVFVDRAGKGVDDAKQSFEDLGATIDNQVASGLSQAATDFENFGQIVLGVLKNIAAEMVKTFALKAIGNLGSGGILGGLGSVFGFQSGGRIPPNSLARVGEQGQELVRTGSQGATVHPLATPVTINVPIPTGSIFSAESVRQMLEAINEQIRDGAVLEGITT